MGSGLAGPVYGMPELLGGGRLACWVIHLALRVFVINIEMLDQAPDRNEYLSINITRATIDLLIEFFGWAHPYLCEMTQVFFLPGIFNLGEEAELDTLITRSKTFTKLFLHYVFTMALAL